MEDIFDSQKYLSKYEHKLRSKVHDFFTVKGLVKFFNDHSLPLNDPEKLAKVIKLWTKEIEEPDLIVYTRNKGTPLSQDKLFF
jgi:hypothetical protein